MTIDHDALETLLEETQAAHGVYEESELNGVYDQAWAAWYARFAVEHGIGRIVGRDVDAAELEGWLTTGWAELGQPDPGAGEPWPAATARQIAARLEGG